MRFSLIKSFLIYIIPVLLVLITPFIWSDTLYNGLITAKQIWFYGAMSLLILVTGIGLMFHRKTISFRLNIIDFSLLAFYIYFFIRAALTPYTPLIYNTRFLNYSLLLVFYFIVKFIASGPYLNNDTESLIDVKKERKLLSPIEILGFVLISTGLVQAIWGLLQLYGITRSFHSGFKITGTFFNPAPYALYLAAIFPLALGNLFHTKDKVGTNEVLLENHRDQGTEQWVPLMTREGLMTSIHKLIYYISLLTVISIILVLPATMNRASWLGLTIGSLVVFNYKYNLLNRTKSYLHNTSRKLFAFAIVILVICLSTSGLYFLKKGSSNGRLLIWEVTINKIVEKPLFGQGVGRFEAEYNNWQAEYFKTHASEMEGPKGMVVGNTKYCFNEYLEMGLETGMVGMLLFLCFIGIMIYSGFRNIKPDETQSSGYFPYLLSAFISLIVMALISFPFDSLPTHIVFFFLAAIISFCVKKDLFHVKELQTSILLLKHRSLILLILLPFSLILLIFTRQQLKAYYTFDETVKLYQAGGYSEACKSFSGIYNPLQYKGYYLQYYGKALMMNEKYQPGLVMLRRAEHFTSDEILYTTIGDTYKALKRYSDAEEAYLRASFMVPHKLYPLYLLANLYEETGQNAKALITAEQVLNKEIKVESTATVEIMQAMRKLIEKIKKK